MKAKNICMAALLILGLASVLASSAQAAAPYVTGFNAYGYGNQNTYRPYEPSFYVYSPLKYCVEPRCNWEYGCRVFRTGFLYGGPMWTYSPCLIPPVPGPEFRCCYNCGNGCEDQPCCPLCNLNGCCHHEMMRDADPTYVTPREAANMPTAAIPAATSRSASAVAPADGSADVPTSSSVPASSDSTSSSSHAGIFPISYRSSQTPAQMSRLTNVDVRDSRGAVFNIWAPNQARVYVNGYETRSVGSKRKFVSFGLRPGLDYEYNIEAIVEKDGKTYQESQKVVVQAGAVKTIAFAFPDLNTKPSEDFEY